MSVRTRSETEPRASRNSENDYLRARERLVSLTGDLCMLMRFLNTNFGLWCLSGLAAGLLSFSYSEHTQRLQASERAVDRTRNVLSEMLGRLEQMDPHVANSGFSPDELRSLLLQPPTLRPDGVLIKSGNGGRDVRVLVFAMFPENADRSLMALALELPHIPSYVPTLVGQVRLSHESVRTLREPIVKDVTELTHVLSSEPSHVVYTKLPGLVEHLKLELSAALNVLDKPSS